MELSYLISAIRKRPWIILLGLILGAVGAAGAAGSPIQQYEAQSIVLIQPPSSATGGTAVTDANRYLASQLSVLNSLDLAEAVATRMGGTYTRDSIKSSMRIVERVGTDVVDVFATAVDAPTAARLANTYVTLYLEDLDNRAKSSSQGDIDEINTNLVALQGQMATALSAVAQAKLIQITAAIGDNPIQITPDLVPGDPTQQVAYDTLLQQYQNLLVVKTNLDTAARTKVNTEVVQQAVEPTIPLGSSRMLFVVAGGFAGAVLGLLVTVMSARLSRKLIDDTHAEAILGHAVVGMVGKQSALNVPLPELLRANGYSALNVIDELCVRAEANARRAGFVTIAVVGTEQSAGATTLATAMAGQFARFGSTVLLVDADPRRAGITEGFKAFGDGGIPALLASAPDGTLTSGRRASDSFRKARNVVTATSVPEVAVLGRGDKSGAPSLRRSDVDSLLERSLGLAPVVIVDAGAVLDAASTVELCRLVDAVVLAVPTQRQSISQLEVVARQLGRRQGELLPVATRPRKHRDGLGAPVTVETAEPVVSATSFDETVVSESNDDVVVPVRSSRGRRGRQDATIEG